MKDNNIDIKQHLENLESNLQNQIITTNFT